MEVIIHLAGSIVLLGLIVWVCIVFTNAVEHLGKILNLGHGAVGSIFAAVGTALPETIVPLVAILGAVFISHDPAVGEQIGMGAILGAPFLLSTLAMCLVGLATFIFAGMKLRPVELNANPCCVLRDMKYFFVSYTIAIAAGFVPVLWIKYVMGTFLLLYYCYYVYRTIIKSKEAGFDEEEELAPLLICTLLKRPACTPFLIGLQVIVTLMLLVIFAHLFVEEIKFFSVHFGINPLILSLIIAPIATELPEKVNSIFWIRQHKDTLALGNITGAMVFQSAIPVAVGIFLTPWVFDNSSIVNITMVFCASILLCLGIIITKRVLPQLLLLCGIFYLMFLGYVILQMF